MNLLHYGLQRSGTNFLETILKRNFKVRFLNSNRDRSSPVQKHCRLYDEKDVVPHPQYRNNIIVRSFEQFEDLFRIRPQFYLVISKDPYSWFLSYSNWARKCNWPPVDHHYIEEYNLYYGKLLDLSSQTDKFIFVRYVDMISDTKAILKHLQEKMALQKSLMAAFASIRPVKVRLSSKFTEERRAYYSEQRYLKDYDSEALQQLNRLLNPRVVSLLGYERREGIPESRQMLSESCYAI